MRRPCNYPSILAALVTTAVAATTTLCTPLALADGQPKVCVAVAGDPDAGVRQAALTLSDALDARADLRGVGDPDARAVLRGETRPDSSLAALMSARRGLAGTDADATGLDVVGNQLGCALVVEIAARPANLQLRAYDVVHRSFRGRLDVGTVDASIIDRFVLSAAQASVANATPAQPVASTGASASTQPTGPRAAGEPWPSDGTDSAPPATTHAGPLPPAAPAATGAAASRAEAESAPPQSTQQAQHGSSGPGIAAWGVAGGLALLLIVGFFVAQGTSSDTPVITVSHAGR